MTCWVFVWTVRLHCSYLQALGSLPAALPSPQSSAHKTVRMLVLTVTSDPIKLPSFPCFTLCVPAAAGTSGPTAQSECEAAVEFLCWRFSLFDELLVFSDSEFSVLFANRGTREHLSEGLQLWENLCIQTRQLTGSKYQRKQFNPTITKTREFTSMEVIIHLSVHPSICPSIYLSILFQNLNLDRSTGVTASSLISSHLESHLQNLWGLWVSIVTSAFNSVYPVGEMTFLMSSEVWPLSLRCVKHSQLLGHLVACWNEVIAMNFLIQSTSPVRNCWPLCLVKPSDLWNDFLLMEVRAA